MREALFIVLVLVLPERTAWPSETPPCGLFAGAYRSEIAARIKKGVPFELMAVATDKDNLLCKQVVHVTFDLWDEVVTLRRGDSILAKTPIAQTEVLLCKNLLCGPTDKLTQPYRVRILLNPLWEGRVARLQSSAPIGSSGAVTIDWKKLATELPSEKVLLDTEVSP